MSHTGTATEVKEPSMPEDNEGSLTWLNRPGIKPQVTQATQECPGHP